jgi:ABC-type xylose transport system substrate-binding protein
VQQAETRCRGAEERFGDVRPYNVEFFGGSPDDNNAYFFYDGAMSVLQPLIDERQGQHRVGPDGHGHGRHAALGRRGRAGAHG